MRCQLTSNPTLPSAELYVRRHMTDQSPRFNREARWLPLGVLPRALVAIWFLVSSAVLVATLWLYAPGPRSDVIVLFAWAMSALSFPTGLAVSAAVAILLVAAEAANLTGSIPVPNWLGLWLVWLAFCAAGYFQWFVALPLLWQRYRAASARATRAPRHPLRGDA